MPFVLVWSRIAAPSGIVVSSSGCCGDASSLEEVMRSSSIELSLLSLELSSAGTGLNCVSSKNTVLLIVCLSMSMASSGITDLSSDCVGNEGSYFTSGGM